MSKHFSIKKLTLIVLMLICFLGMSTSVKANPITKPTSTIEKKVVAADPSIASEGKIFEDRSEGKEMGCEDEHIAGIRDILSKIYTLIRFSVPVIIIIYSVVEFAGVVVSGEQENMEKAKKHFVVRLLIGILVLLVPVLLEVPLKLAGIIDSNLSDVVCKIF